MNLLFYLQALHTSKVYLRLFQDHRRMSNVGEVRLHWQREKMACEYVGFGFIRAVVPALSVLHRRELRWQRRFLSRCSSHFVSRHIFAGSRMMSATVCRQPSILSLLICRFFSFTAWR